VADRIWERPARGPQHEYRPNDLRARLRLHPLLHELWSALRFVGVRDRLRCPECKAVGTWKPHGYWVAQRRGDRPVRRWLCKCCGLYNGPEGTTTCWPDRVLNVWALPEGEPYRTPYEVLMEDRVWPWKG
jgi:hypothetical protein